MSVENRSRGASKFSVIVTLLFFAALVYLGGQVFNFYYSYYELEGLMDQQARKASVFSDKEMRQLIFKRVKELQIPIDEPEEIKINRLEGKVVIETQYSEVLYVEFRDKTYDLHVFSFNPRIEVPM